MGRVSLILLSEKKRCEYIMQDALDINIQCWKDEIRDILEAHFKKIEEELKNKYPLLR